MVAALIQGPAVVLVLANQQPQTRDSGYDDGLAAGRRILAKKRISPLHDTPLQLLRAAIAEADKEAKKVADCEPCDERYLEYVTDYVEGLQAAESELPD